MSDQIVLRVESCMFTQYLRQYSSEQCLQGFIRQWEYSVLNIVQCGSHSHTLLVDNLNVATAMQNINGQLNFILLIIYFYFKFKQSHMVCGHHIVSTTKNHSPMIVNYLNIYFHFTKIILMKTNCFPVVFQNKWLISKILFVSIKFYSLKFLPLCGGFFATVLVTNPTVSQP